ncbi:MAG TPA: hypothetical protein VFE98_02840 [Candidatus Bathyarchaeia archaeon]|nr:hypothetical protein [Candidatus Bathyarchaeia archaeon]
MAFASSPLPFWLTAIGIALVFAGTGWALLKRKSRTPVVRSWIRGENSDVSLPGDDLSDDSIGLNTIEARSWGRTGSMKGVHAIFTPEDIPTRKVSRTMLVGLVEAGLLVLIYAGLVGEYSSSLSMQSWVRANFAIGEILLSYNAALVFAGILAVLAFGLFFQRDNNSMKSRKAKRRRNR